MLPKTYISEIENKDMLFVSHDKTIPDNYSGISCSIEMDSEGNLDIKTIKHEQPDPSTIWVYLPINKTETPEPLPYFPHYIDLTPGQRYTYLNWLRNIETPIDIGYVFLYFYGLERHLVLGDIDKAVKQIVRLRKYHKNKSFIRYSKGSIIHACVMRERLDLLLEIEEIETEREFSNTQLYLADKLNLNLSANSLLDIFKKLFPKSRKAIKEDREIMATFVEDSMLSLSKESTIKTRNIDTTKAPIIKENRFCNYTFPLEMRFIKIPNFYNCKEFIAEMELIFNTAYENYKKDKAIRRIKTT